MKLKRKIKKNQRLIKKMRTITELKIKWEDSFLFFVGPVASQERKRRRNKKLKHRQTTENHDTRASPIEAPPLVKSGDIVIRLFGH